MPSKDTIWHRVTFGLETSHVFGEGVSGGRWRFVGYRGLAVIAGDRISVHLSAQPQ